MNLVPILIKDWQNIMLLSVSEFNGLVTGETFLNLLMVFFGQYKWAALHRA